MQDKIFNLEFSGKEKAEKLVIAALSNFEGEDFGDTMQFCQICQNFPSSELYYGSRYQFIKLKRHNSQP